MIDLIRTYQLNIMLLLCGACGVMAALLLMTRFLDQKKKWVLFLMEIVAFFLLWFERLAYVYSGDVSPKGFVMVRVSNCMVFLLTSGIVFTFNFYLNNLFTKAGETASGSKRLTFVGVIAAVGMVLSVVSAFIGIYYYFDENNV